MWSLSKDLLLPKLFRMSQEGPSRCMSHSLWNQANVFSCTSLTSCFPPKRYNTKLGFPSPLFPSLLSFLLPSILSQLKKSWKCKVKHFVKEFVKKKYLFSYFLSQKFMTEKNMLCNKRHFRFLWAGFSHSLFVFLFLDIWRL